MKASYPCLPGTALPNARSTIVGQSDKPCGNGSQKPCGNHSHKACWLGRFIPTKLVGTFALAVQSVKTLAECDTIPLPLSFSALYKHAT